MHPEGHKANRATIKRQAKSNSTHLVINEVGLYSFEIPQFSVRRQYSAPVRTEIVPNERHDIWCT